MAIQARNTLKGWFKTGKKPTQAQFSDWLDSYFHVNDNIPLSSVIGLVDILNNTAAADSLTAHVADLSAHGLDGYVKLDGSRVMTGNLDFGTHNLNNVGIIKASSFAGYMTDASSNSSLDFRNRSLVASGGALVLLWESQQLVDTADKISIDWQNRSIRDAAQLLAINYQSRTLVNVAQNIIADWSGDRLSLNAAPLLANDAATKGYVDQLVEGLDWKEAVDIATTANITLSGLQTIDGVSGIADMRVLVKDQTTATQNGIYLMKSGSWVRSDDASIGSELIFAVVRIKQGTVNADKVFRNDNETITIGTDNIVFSEWSLSSYTVGTGLTLTGSQIDFDTAYIDIANRKLKDQFGTTALTWTSAGRFLIDNNNKARVDWNNAQLLDSDGATIVVNWGNRQLVDSGSKIAVDWENYYLKNTTIVIDWFNYRMYNATDLFLDWGNGNFFKTSDTTKALGIFDRSFYNGAAKSWKSQVGTGLAFAAIGGVISDHYNDVGTVTTAEADLYSDTIIANTLANDGDKIVAYYSGMYTPTSTDNRELIVYFAGQAVFGSNNINYTTTVQPLGWEIITTIIRTSSTTAKATTKLITATSSFTDVEDITGLDFTIDNILKITGTSGTGTTNDIIAKMAYVEFKATN